MKNLPSLISPATAGIVSVLVGFTSSVALIFQAATAAGATPDQTSSWILALCLGAGLTSIGFSLYFKKPILTAWSTPGAAILASSLGSFSMNEIIGAFIVTGALITLSGVTGIFEKVLNKIPVPLASAMLVGVLFKFGLQVFIAMGSQFGMIISMLVVYLIAKRFTPRYAIIFVLLLGMTLANFLGLIHFDQVHLSLTKLVFVSPEFSLNAIISIGLPLFAVTMASQNLPGVVVLKSFNYNVPISKVITGTGLATLLLAPFGAFSINLAAITAAICMGKDAHEDPEKRYIASTIAGFFYLILGALGATVSTLFMAFPLELIAAVAGLALFGTIANGLTVAMSVEKDREAALITLLVSASGLTLFGVGSAFWGLVFGTLALSCSRLLLTPTKQ